MVSDFARVARQLWQEARGGVVTRAQESLDAALQWQADGDPSAWATLTANAHQLAGSLGSYAAALRAGAEGEPDPGVEAAADAAVVLDRIVQEPEREADEVVTAARALVQALDSV